MSVEITNISNKPLRITATSAIPIYGRSADNLRDHRHVTNLLNKVYINKFGIILKPVMVFNEKGHFLNKTCYFVLGYNNNSLPPKDVCPIQDEFTGKNGDLECPEFVINNPKKINSSLIHGQDVIGALRFKTKTLLPKEKVIFNLILGIGKDLNEANRVFNKFNSWKKISVALEENNKFWLEKSKSIAFSTGNKEFDNWTTWVNIQPTLRKIFGCSFLPHFDYGKGNRGWRDIWQDYLGLIVNASETKELRSFIVNSFSGVRIDGTNATIITKNKGEFIADRNSIPRVWMDHGLWPFFTLELYINYTSDIDILFEETTYLKDHIHKRAKELLSNNQISNKLLNRNNSEHKSTILEHTLLQHLVQFFNVGRHNNIRLENADWNDGLDMASLNGESITFSAFYASNLCAIADLLILLKDASGIKTVSISKEITLLLDTITGPIKYDNFSAKLNLLNKYFEKTKNRISTNKINLPIDKVIYDLKKKSDWVFQHINKTEWINVDKNCGFFNGYYDNKSKRLEGLAGSKINMLLESQVFPILSGIAGKEKTKKIIKAANKYLWDKQLSGFRLNTDFKTPLLNLGRAFSFSYGDKENGAIFSHMCVMFAYALFKNDFTQAAWKTLLSLYKLSKDTEKSLTYPNLPEYFNLKGNGLYSYLTGSASWFVFTLLTQGFGVRGELGDLIINPKLTKDIFNNDTVSVSFRFADKNIKISYINKKRLSYPNYKLGRLLSSVNNLEFLHIDSQTILIRKSTLKKLPSELLNLNITIS